MTGEVLEGELPGKAMNLVREWIVPNQKALMDIWETQE